jgi:hypothetical protein
VSEAWHDVAGRALVEAVEADRRDVVLLVGDGPRSDVVAAELSRRVATLVRVGDLSDPPPGLSVICAHWSLRRLAPVAQRAFVARAGSLLPRRGLLVIGDVMWSMPPDQIDAPEQFGDAIESAQMTRTLEGWARDAGFLPDVHRFGVGVGMLVGVRA